MKTPREILLARHKAVNPKLDDIRQDAVVDLDNIDCATRTAQKTRSFSTNFLSSVLNCPYIFWRELIWPARRIWTGLGVAWILILAVNLSMRDHAESKMATSRPSTDEITAFRQQQQLLSELIGPDDAAVGESPKTYSPHPAGERRPAFEMT